MCPNIRTASAAAYCEKVQSCLKKMTEGGERRGYAGACAHLPEVHRTRVRALSTLTVCEEIRTTTRVRSRDSAHG